MFFKILKKDLIRKKTMNVIMLLFIILASMFMGSSLNNLVVSTTSVDNFFRLANTADVIFVVAGSDDRFKEADEFFSGRDDITEFGSSQAIMGMETNLQLQNGEPVKLENSDMAIYLTKNPTKYSKIFSTDNELFTINDGEIAMPNFLAEQIGVSAGDRLTIHFVDKDRTYTVTTITKDAGFGTSMGGSSRLVMSDHDYDEVAAMYPAKVSFYHVFAEDTTSVIRAASESLSGLRTTVSKSLFILCYLFDVMMAVVMLIVSVCLLLVAFMILRFTITFTLENDYKEIGVLKAVGIRNRSIRELYLSKYTALSVIGSFIGCAFSFPFCNLLNASLDKNIVGTKSGGFAWVNILSAVFVILMVVLFCYRCTKKLNKFSAIEAIRCGSKGETFRTKSRIALHRIRKLPVSLSLALNDVAGSIRRYAIMIVTFLVCLLLMVIPMVAVKTLSKPDVILDLLGVNTGGLYIYGPTREISLKADRKYLEDYLNKMDDEITALGYDVEVSTTAFLFCTIEYPDKSGEYSINSVMDINTDKQTVTAIEGTLSVRANEFMLSEAAFDEFGGKIGDTYRMTFGDKTYDMILTGKFSNMNNLGRTAHVTNLLTPDFKQLSSVSSMSVLFNDDLTKTELKEAQEKIRALYSNYTIYNSEEYAENFMGTYIDMFNDTGNIIKIIVLIIVFLVSLLMSKSFVARETGESALLRSIGIKKASIRSRHILRIVICLTLSLAAFYIISAPLANLIISRVFRLFGAYNVHAVFDPLYIYLIYPLMILADILLSGWVGTLAVNRIDPKEVNNAE